MALDQPGGTDAGIAGGIDAGIAGGIAGAPGPARPSRLEALQQALSCPICTSAFSTPLVLRTCGHSFCASCVRTNFDYQQQSNKSGGLACPVCRKGCDDRDLVLNVVLREVVEAYTKAEEELRAQGEAMARMDTARRRSRRRGPAVREKQEVVVVRLDEEEDADDEDRVHVKNDDDTDDGNVEDRGGEIGGCSTGREDASQSSGEEYDPYGDDRTRGGRKRTERPQARGDGAAVAHTGSSFVPCPVCGKDVHHMYMNSHIDACLQGNGQGNGQGDGDGTRGSRGARGGPGGPRGVPSALDVPPKLVLLGGLSNPGNEKKLRHELKKYNIPTEGCATARELFDRYTRFRTAVEISNDKGEVGASYEKIVFRLMKEDRNKKMAGMFEKGGSSKKARVGGVEDGRGGALPRQATLKRENGHSRGQHGEVVTIDMTGVEASAAAARNRRFDPAAIDLASVRHPREIILPEDATFEEMVEVTRLRDRVRASLLDEYNQ